MVVGAIRRSARRKNRWAGGESDWKLLMRSSKHTYTEFLNEDTSEGGHMQAVQRAKPTQVVKALFVDLATAVPRAPGNSVFVQP